MGIKDNLMLIRADIMRAAESAGRDPQTVRLLAVSKTFPTEDVWTAYEAGQRLFGENKVQEGLIKVPATPDDCEWHLIGPLQRNKVRKALKLFTWIHSVDSLKLLKYMDSVAEEMAVSPKILFEVNVGEEESKFGFSPDNLKKEWSEIAQCKNVQPMGLMCIPPSVEEAEEARPYFQKLRLLRDELKWQGPFDLPELSMGMSHDFPIAVQEGATIVRVGTAIFGGRNYAQ